jgi:hypothetical protein
LYDQSCVACGHVPGPAPLPLRRSDYEVSFRAGLAADDERTKEEQVAEYAARDQRIRKFRAKGLSVEYLAARFKLSARSIHRVCQ